MAEPLSVVQECGDYSVIRDIPYCATDCHGQKFQESLRYKYRTDLYLPKVDLSDSSVQSRQPSQQARKIPPLVVFVHGGGWRRGDKSLWRHFTSEDVNLLVAFIYWSFGLYGNVGRALARRGLACAVLSYPLSKLKSIWMLLEIFTSYTCSAMFLAAVFGTGLVLFFLLQIIFSIGSLGDLIYLYLGFSGSYILDLISVHLVASNLFIFVIISLQYYKYHSLSLPVLASLWVLIATVYPTCVHHGISPGYAFICLFLLSFVIPQGIIVFNILTSKQSFPVDQCRTLAMCIKKIRQIGEQSGDFDTRSIVLMGHSAGGHLCAMSTLEGSYLQREGIPLSYIKGVITMSAVLRVDQLNFRGMKQLYLYPTFGVDQQHWKALSPLYRLKSEPKHVPNFLVVTAEQDFHLEEDAKAFIQELQNWNVYSRKVIIPQTNHTSVVCYFERCREFQSQSLADECADFIFKSTN